LLTIRKNDLGDVVTYYAKLLTVKGGKTVGLNHAAAARIRHAE